MVQFPLPLTDEVQPTTIDELVAAVRDAAARGLPIYPIGGGTSLDYGLLPQTSGRGIVLAQLNRVIDYPARDMTITVEAGMTMRQLADTLAVEGQWLPIDVPFPEQATIGGVIATNCSGPRRFGQGTMRDYVIGIHAVSADGTPFKAGGRVVKNVAGYDFCKLLTGSLGTLAIITQVTLKLKPVPKNAAIVSCAIRDWAELEPRLATLNVSSVAPAAVELYSGNYWKSSQSTTRPSTADDALAGLSVLVEGTTNEVAWMQQQLCAEWQAPFPPVVDVDEVPEAQSWVDRWTAFPASKDHELVIKAAVLPSHVAGFVAMLRHDFPDASVLAHAADGIVIIAFHQFPDGGLAQTVVRHIAPRAKIAGGHAIVLSNATQSEMTHQAVWGGSAPCIDIMSEIKRAWDPFDRLNPGRFVYHAQ